MGNICSLDGILQEDLYCDIKKSPKGSEWVKGRGHQLRDDHSNSVLSSALFNHGIKVQCQKLYISKEKWLPTGGIQLGGLCPELVSQGTINPKPSWETSVDYEKDSEEKPGKRISKMQGSEWGVTGRSMKPYKKQQGLPIEPEANGWSRREEWPLDTAPHPWAPGIHGVCGGLTQVSV